MFEFQTPNIIVRHEYAPDSMGSGRWRGGLGVETVIKLDGENSKGVVFGDGIDTRARAFGLFGGKEGAVNELEVRFPDGRIHKPQSKEIVPDLPRGTIVRQVAGGGGGYGDPNERPLAQVAKEVRNGILSIQKAEADYGLALTPGSFDVDLMETERLRRRQTVNDDIEK
jgi:N-methylhydantoinase B